MKRKFYDTGPALLVAGAMIQLGNKMAIKLGYTARWLVILTDRENGEKGDNSRIPLMPV